MPQDIHIESKEGYLHVEVFGVFDCTKAKEFVRQILNACHQHAVWKIFVDIRNIKGPIPTMSRFELAEFLASEQTVPVRMAVLESQVQVPNDRFFENVAVNRGAIVKVSTELGEAFEWLEIRSGNSSDAGGGK